MLFWAIYITVYCGRLLQLLASTSKDFMQLHLFLLHHNVISSVMAKRLRQAEIAYNYSRHIDVALSSEMLMSVQNALGSFKLIIILL